MRRAEFARAVVLTALAALILAPAAKAADGTLSTRLAPLGFLVGSWTGDAGRAEGGQAARGTFTIKPAAGGRALLRRDHTEVLGSGGKVAQVIEQIMLIYPEGGHLRGDYFDGKHAIHYADAVITPGQSVRFTTAEAPGAPAFKLTYSRLPGERIAVMFEMRAPGESTYRTIAEGSAHREARTR